MVRIILGIGLPIALAVAEEGERVPGVARSRTAHPVVIDDPDDSFLEETDERISSEPISYQGTGHYALRQGTRYDDKLKHLLTDYLVWTAQGATLVAEGQCSDGDPSETTRLSSKAWGAETVEAKITAEQGEQGMITAENRIGFSYTYNIQGSKILEATVQLNGQCVDIDGGSHRFALSDTRSSAVTESVREVRVAGVRLSRGNRDSIATTRNGVGASSENSSNVAFEANSTIDMTVTRELAQAGGNSGGASGPVVEDTVSGETPLEKTYSVYSAGTVVLSARGDNSAGQGGTTEVFLENFKIENTLRVFIFVSKAVRDGDVEDEPAEEPGNGSSGSDGGAADGAADDPDGGSDDGIDDGNDEGNDEGSEDGENGSGDPHSDGEAQPEPESGESTGSMDLDGLEGLDGLRVKLEVIAPFGLAGEPGGTSGEFRVTLNRPAPRDLLFSARVTPQDSLTLSRGETVTIAAGEIAGGGPLFRAAGSEAFVSLHLLDVDGSLSGRELVVRTQLVSTASRTEPSLYACADGDAWLAGADALITGIRGRSPPALLIGRLGFAGFETETTTVTIAVSDPQGVLGPLPSAVALTPEMSETTVPLQLEDAEGIAVLTLQAGSESIEVHVVSRTQGWDSLPVIRVPLGATAAVPYRLLWPEADSRTIVATMDGSEHAEVVAGSESDSLAPGALAWATRVRGTALGLTAVRLESDGLPPLLVPIEVVAPRVEFLAGSLRLSHLPVPCEGTIRVLAPAGVRLESVTVPAELADSITVEGLGSEEILLTLRASPNLPATLLLPVVLAGDLAGEPAGGLIFDVDERLVEDTAPVAHNNYQVEWK